MQSKVVTYESEEEEEEEVSRSYTPLSFYMASTVDYPGPMSYKSPTVDDPGPICMSNYIPLSLFPLGSTPICMANEENFRNYTESNMVVANEKKVRNYTMEVDKVKSKIPDKISFSILSKLTVKSLKRFQCVQKSWSVLFENSDFMTMYTDNFVSRHACQNSDHHTFLLTCHLQVPTNPDSRNHAQFHLLHNNTLKFSLPPPLFQQHCHCKVSILCSTSVYGIFCFGQIYRSKNEVRYVLWNPATGNFRVIPPSINELKPHYPINKLYLRHDFHGFGYDQVRDDFKLVQFVSFLSDDGAPLSNFFEIYSLSTNSWRMIDMGIPHSYWAYPASFHGEEVYLDGACHWLCTRFTRPQHIDISITLLSFDLNDEVFITTPIGEEYYTTYTFAMHLTVLNGSIALISNYHDDIVFHIYILGELGVGESWIKLYIYGPLPSIKWPPIGFGKTGYLFFTKKDYQLVYVDLSTQIVKELGVNCGETSYFMLGLYKESLYSIGRARI